jgi:hypothetical protein
LSNSATWQSDSAEDVIVCREAVATEPQVDALSSLKLVTRDSDWGHQVGWRLWFPVDHARFEIASRGRRHPVGARVAGGTPGGLQPSAEVGTLLGLIRNAHGVEALEISCATKIADLNQDRTRPIYPDRHPCFEHDVLARLAF